MIYNLNSNALIFRQRYYYDSPNDEEHEGEDLEHEVDEPGVGAAADQPGVVRVGGEAAETQGQVDAADHQVGEQRERQHRGEDHAVHAVQSHCVGRVVFQ